MFLILLQGHKLDAFVAVVVKTEIKKPVKKRGAHAKHIADQSWGRSLEPEKGSASLLCCLRLNSPNFLVSFKERPYIKGGAVGAPPSDLGGQKGAPSAQFPEIV